MKIAFLVLVVLLCSDFGSSDPEPIRRGKRKRVHRVHLSRPLHGHRQPPVLLVSESITREVGYKQRGRLLKSGRSKSLRGHRGKIRNVHLGAKYSPIVKEFYHHVIPGKRPPPPPPVLLAPPPPPLIHGPPPLPIHDGPLLPPHPIHDGPPLFPSPIDFGPPPPPLEQFHGPPPPLEQFHGHPPPLEQFHGHPPQHDPHFSHPVPPPLPPIEHAPHPPLPPVENYHQPPPPPPQEHIPVPQEPIKHEVHITHSIQQAPPPPQQHHIDPQHHHIEDNQLNPPFIPSPPVPDTYLEPPRPQPSFAHEPLPEEQTVSESQSYYNKRPDNFIPSEGFSPPLGSPGSWQPIINTKNKFNDELKASIGSLQNSITQLLDLSLLRDTTLLTSPSVIRNLLGSEKLQTPLLLTHAPVVLADKPEQSVTITQQVGDPILISQHEPVSIANVQPVQQVVSVPQNQVYFDFGSSQPAADLTPPAIVTPQPAVNVEQVVHHVSPQPYQLVTAVTAPPPPSYREENPVQPQDVAVTIEKATGYKAAEISVEPSVEVFNSHSVSQNQKVLAEQESHVSTIRPPISSTFAPPVSVTPEPQISGLSPPPQLHNPNQVQYVQYAPLQPYVQQIPAYTHVVPVRYITLIRPSVLHGQTYQQDPVTAESAQVPIADNVAAPSTILQAPPLPTILQPPSAGSGLLSQQEIYRVIYDGLPLQDIRFGRSNTTLIKLALKVNGTAENGTDSVVVEPVPVEDVSEQLAAENIIPLGETTNDNTIVEAEQVVPVQQVQDGNGGIDLPAAVPVTTSDSSYVYYNTPDSSYAYYTPGSNSIYAPLRTYKTHGADVKIADLNKGTITYFKYVRDNNATNSDDVVITPAEAEETVGESSETNLPIDYISTSQLDFGEPDVSEEPAEAESTIVDQYTPSESQQAPLYILQVVDENGKVLERVATAGKLNLQPGELSTSGSVEVNDTSVETPEIKPVVAVPNFFPFSFVQRSKVPEVEGLSSSSIEGDDFATYGYILDDASTERVNVSVEDYSAPVEDLPKVNVQVTDSSIEDPVSEVIDSTERVYESKKIIESDQSVEPASESVGSEEIPTTTTTERTTTTTVRLPKRRTRKRKILHAS